MVVHLFDGLARRARREGKFHLYFPDDELPDDMDVGSVHDVELVVRVDTIDSENVKWSSHQSVGIIRAEVVGVTRTRIQDLERYHLMEDVAGYRNRKEVLNTLRRRYGHVLPTDIVNVVTFYRWDYDLSKLKCNLGSNRSDE